MRRRKERGLAVFDEIDLKIATLLQDNARLSCSDLADAVGLSRSATWERQKRLERVGLIVGYRATIAPSAVGRDIDAIIRLELRATAATGFRTFEGELRNCKVFVSAQRIAKLGVYELRSASRHAVPWLDAAIVRCGLVVEAFDTLLVAEEIIAHRDPPVRTLVEAAAQPRAGAS